MEKNRYMKAAKATMAKMKKKKGGDKKKDGKAYDHHESTVPSKSKEKDE
tara:strand:+ start:1617 stop:1763 length:147 start_codon:yes stop_codon:yes gene_type:complete